MLFKLLKIKGPDDGFVYDTNKNMKQLIKSNIFSFYFLIVSQNN